MVAAVSHEIREIISYSGASTSWALLPLQFLLKRSCQGFLLLGWASKAGTQLSPVPLQICNLLLR